MRPLYRTYSPGLVLEEAITASQLVVSAINLALARIDAVDYFALSAEAKIAHDLLTRNCTDMRLVSECLNDSVQMALGKRPIPVVPHDY